VWRDYHKLEDLVASESRIRRQKEASALPLSKVRTIEEARPAPRKRSTGIPGSFLDNDESSKRSSKNEIEDNSAQSGRSFQKDCNKCTCTDGEILCTLKKCKEVVEFDEDDDNDYEPQPAPRRQVRRPAPRSHAPVRDYVDDQPIPAPPVYTPVVASTVKPTDGSLSLYVENTQRIFDGLRSSFTGTTTPFMVCVSHEGQPLEVVQVSGGYFRHQRIVVNIGSGNQLLSCAPAGATIYLSGMDSGKIVFLHYMVITSQVVQSGAGPVRAYRLMESRTYRSPSVPIRSEIQYKFQATMGPRK